MASRLGSGDPGTLKVRASLKNVASFAQPYPLLKLVLEDRWGERVREREFEPAEYLDPATAPDRLLAPAQQATATISIVDPGPDAEGFRFDVCLRGSRGIVCAADVPERNDRRNRSASVPTLLPNNLALAPMAGVTDLPFRLLCRRMGAGIAAGEMLTSDVRLWHTEKSRRRMDHTGEAEPRVVQIAGGDPQMMAEAAQRNVDAGAQIIDINMGCPAKKVCNKAAGSALMKDEPLVRQILEAVVNAVSRAGDVEDAHGLGPGASQRRDDRPDGGSDRHPGAGRSRPHARVHVSGRRRVRNDPRDQAERRDSDFRQWRHRLTAQSEART